MDAQDDRWRQAVAYADRWLLAYRDAIETECAGSLSFLAWKIASEARVNTPEQDARFDALLEMHTARCAVRQ